MTLNVPGKIFISGEYAALKGMPTLTVAVDPSFTFSSHTEAPKAFHPESPAGLLNPNVVGEFQDPYQEIGGMGRSSAEFIAAASNSEAKRSIWEVWDLYRKVLANEKNIPSGIDILTQLQGGYCLTEARAKHLETSAWPFADLDWIALITGNKIKTHEHLAKPLSLDWEMVEKLNLQIVEAWKSQNSVNFLKALNLWRGFLLDSGLETSATTELVDFFLDTSGVLSAKGCGAMGSDVVLIIFDKNDSETLEKSLEHWNPDRVIRSSQVNFSGTQILEKNENLSTF